MKHLPEVTLICVDCVNYGQSIFAIKKSLEQITPARAVFLTDIDIKVDDVEVIKIDPIRSKEEYSRFIIKELYKYFTTPYVLIIQWDGYVLNGECWDNAFLSVDYAGACWLESDGLNVGNGGFSLRSKRLQNLLATDLLIEITHPEDSVTCRLYRPYLEEMHGIKYAKEELAQAFSFELHTPYQPTFGFHGLFHQPFKPHVIVKRSGAMGDVIDVEPVLAHLHFSGYKVYLDTNPEYYRLFNKHYYPIHNAADIDWRTNPKIINLDMAYEVTPKRLHLESYYEVCGITDGVLRNPRLRFKITPDNKLFKKYIVLHIDERNEPHRNIYGIDWKEVKLFLESLGYTVIQIGKGQHEEIAPLMNTANTGMLMYLIAGADLFIGIDSGPSHMAIALGVKSVIFVGSVNPNDLYADPTAAHFIHRHKEKVCARPFCWAETVGTTGTDCYISESDPPCTKYDTVSFLKELANSNMLDGKQ